MAEPNGSGRLDRIEALLEKTGEKLDRVATMRYLHDERLARIEAGIEEMQGHEKRVDARIDKLVSSTGDLISRIPPTALSR